MHENNKLKVKVISSTVWSSKLSDSINKTFMELDGPSEAGLRVSGEDKTRVPLDTHGSVMRIHS